MASVSTLIVLVQVLIMVIMIVTDGIAPSSENPMVGPPATTLVIWGAKEGGLIKYQGQASKQATQSNSAPLPLPLTLYISISRCDVTARGCVVAAVLVARFDWIGR